MWNALPQELYLHIWVPRHFWFGVVFIGSTFLQNGKMIPFLKRVVCDFHNFLPLVAAFCATVPHWFWRFSRAVLFSQLEECHRKRRGNVCFQSGIPLVQHSNVAPTHCSNSTDTKGNYGHISTTKTLFSYNWIHQGVLFFIHFFKKILCHRLYMNHIYTHLIKQTHL